MFPLGNATNHHGIFPSPSGHGVTMCHRGERTPHEHPVVVIGAGNIGLRQAFGSVRCDGDGRYGDVRYGEFG